jgi:predicted nucleic acid-binding protein
VILLDTNVLIYSVNKAAPQHAASRRVVRLCAAGSLPGVVVPQVLLEFYATMTSGRRVTTPLSPQQARDEMDGFCRRLTVKPVPADVLPHLLAAISVQPRIGQGIFDLFLVAQMKSLSIGDICTYNVADFNFPGIRALEPAEVLKLYPATS